MRWLRLALAMVVVGLAVSAASAQSGALEVRVSDSSGLPLPGAIVTISHDTGFVKETAIPTNKDGLAEFPVLRPGKGYVVEVSFPGFGTRRFADIHVRISDKQTIDVQLAEELQERVKVVAQGDVVDLEETAQSTRFSDEFIQDLPVPGRFYQNVLTLAPGVQDADGDGNPNVHGSRARDFKAIVSGVANVDPLTGQQMSQVNPNSIEEMEVITAGASVEFSRAQGGFARIIQKQGSNEFEGVAEFYFRSSKLDGTGADDFSNLPDPEFDWYQPSFQVSGPIVKDKVWYRFSHEFIEREIPRNVTSGIAVITDDQEIHSDQITWQVSPRNKLAFQYQSDPRDINNFGVSSLTPPEAALRIDRTSEIQSVTWTAPFSPKILIESQIAWQDLNRAELPTSQGISNTCITGEPFLEDAQCFDIDTGQRSGSYFRTVDDHRQRLTVRSQAEVFGGRFWGMSHQFKVGFLAENERYFRDLERRPDMFRFVFQPRGDASSGNNEDPDPIAIIVTRLAVPPQEDVRATGTNWGLFAEDLIRPRQNLSITLGVRVDREEIYSNGFEPVAAEDELQQYLQIAGLNPGGSQANFAARNTFTAYEDIDNFVKGLAVQLGRDPLDVLTQLSTSAQQSGFWKNQRLRENISIVNTNISPAIAVSWDPWSNNKTRFAFTARRYYDKIFLNIPLIELEPVYTSVVFNSQQPPGGGEFRITGLRTSIDPSVNVNVVDRDLGTPYQDEFSFSFEREIAAETSIGLSYINRKYRDQFQDFDLNHAPGDFGFCNRPTLAFNKTVLSSPGQGSEIVDPYTGEVYIDTDPGPGDGRIDDCSGELVLLPEGDEPGESAGNFERDTRLEKPDGIPDLYLQNPGWGDIFLVGNSNKIDYEGYVLTLTRRQYRSWEMQASYTWSKAEGDGEDFAQQLGDDRSLLEDEQGYQSYDQRHVVKVNATTITPWGFRLGTAVSWESGLPYSLLRQQLAFDAIPPQFGNLGAGSPARVRQQYITGRRNDQRNQSFWNVDLKFTKEMNLGRGLNMQVSAEVFNLLNDGTYTIWNPLNSTGQQINGNNLAFRRFGRQWQLGVKMAF